MKLLQTLNISQAPTASVTPTRTFLSCASRLSTAPAARSASALPRISIGKVDRDCVRLLIDRVQIEQNVSRRLDKVLRQDT
jgi:hypothetical protein